MKLNIFNRWKKLGIIHSRPVEYHASKMKGGTMIVAIARDAETKNIVAKAYASDEQSAAKLALEILSKSPVNRFHQAVEGGEPITKMPTLIKKDDAIDWRDGTGHAYRAQKKIVGESKENKPKIRNFVAKHARSFNKAGAMKDKKNDYQRKPKHKKEPME